MADAQPELVLLLLEPFLVAAILVSSGGPWQKVLEGPKGVIWQLRGLIWMILLFTWLKIINSKSYSANYSLVGGAMALFLNTKVRQCLLGSSLLRREAHAGRISPRRMLSPLAPHRRCRHQPWITIEGTLNIAATTTPACCSFQCSHGLMAGFISAAVDVLNWQGNTSCVYVDSPRGNLHSWLRHLSKDQSRKLP
jgi:hypothetical protein